MSGFLYRWRRDQPPKLLVKIVRENFRVYDVVTETFLATGPSTILPAIQRLRDSFTYPYR